MGKHDKSGDYEVARIEELESRLQFAEENVKRLTAEVNKYNKWMSEIEAAAEDKIAEKDARIAQLEKAVDYLKVELKNYKPLPGTPAAPDKSK